MLPLPALPEPRGRLPAGPMFAPRPPPGLKLTLVPDQIIFPLLYLDPGAVIFGFALRISASDILFAAAIPERVSPFFTVY